jgi:uncharacterized protein YdeI (BOF family)
MRILKQMCTALTTVLLVVLMTSPALAQDPLAKPNNTWISVSGTIKAVTADAFLLNYGKGTITVEMDDRDRDSEAYRLLPGDKVTVNGIIDQDFLERKTIEASSVYVENLGTTFYASAVDEEDLWGYVPTPLVLTTTVMEGTVTEVEDEQFMLRVGLSTIEVEVDEMAYNPLDDLGYQQIEEGDRVRVTGHSDYELFDGRVFNARSVVTLRANEAKPDRTH